MAFLDNYWRLFWVRICTKCVDELFKDVQFRADNLPRNERLQIENRLILAKEVLGSNNLLEYFKTWRPLKER